MNIKARTIATIALTAMLAAPIAGAQAASDHREFEGVVTHISSNNIRVKGTEGGKVQDLSFDYLPRIGKLTHNSGKVTSDQRMLHVGEYVKVIYDQKLLGLRHADSVLPWGNSMHKMGQ